MLEQAENLRAQPQSLYTPEMRQCPTLQNLLNTIQRYEARHGHTVFALMPCRCILWCKMVETKVFSLDVTQ